MSCSRQSGAGGSATAVVFHVQLGIALASSGGRERNAEGTIAAGSDRGSTGVGGDLVINGSSPRQSDAREGYRRGAQV